MMLAMPADLQAQGFLKKLKQKAESAVNKAVGIDTGEESAANDTEQTDKRADNPFANQPSATDKLPKLRQSNVVWDGEVTPSTAADYRALLRELPSLPTAAEIAHPTDSKREAYMRKLSSLSMRADELDDEATCSDEEMVAFRDKLYKELEGILGITSEEMRRLEDPYVSDTEKQRIEEKMKTQLLGGMNEEDFATNMENKAKKNEARMKEIQQELKQYEKKAEAGTLTPQEQQRINELTQENMAMVQDMMGGMDGLMGTANKAQVLQDKMMQGMGGSRFDSQLKAFSDKQASLLKNEEGVVKSCDEIADDYENDLRRIYKQIWEETDAGKIHALYDQADERMKNYRERAAAVYIQGLQKRLDNTKALLPEAEQLYANMADDGMIPKCAVARAPLNVVINCIDILQEAYAEFPQPDVLPCKQIAINLSLKKDDRLYPAECGFAAGFGSGAGSVGGGGGGGAGCAPETFRLEFIKNSQLLVYNDTDQCYYKIENGVRTRLDDKGTFDYSQRRAKKDDSYYGEIPLRGGGRKAVVSRDGSLTLHDGTMFYPIAMKRCTEHLMFVVPDYETDGFKLCVYKL